MTQSSTPLPPVHHKTVARGAKYGISFSVVKGGYRICHEPSGRCASGLEPSILLGAFIKKFDLEPLSSMTPSEKRVSTPKTASPVALSSSPATSIAEPVSKPSRALSPVSPATSPASLDDSSPASSNRSVVKKEFKVRYAQLGVTSNGDSLARALSDALLADESALFGIAKENGLPFVWQHLNRGMQRMNLANVLRAKLRREEQVLVCGKKVSK